MQVILGYEQSEYERIRSTGIKENCTITGFDGKHTENHVRFILSLFGSHMVYPPNQLVLSSWRAELFSLTIDQILCWNSNLHLLGTPTGKVPYCPQLK